MIFLELFFFFYDPMDFGNLISGSSGFSKSSLNVWKFWVHVLLKPHLENFEHYVASIWDECNCAAFFGIAFPWDWSENWPFPVLWPLLSFPNLLAYWVQRYLFRFKIAQLEFHHLNQLCFLLKLHKPHLTSHSRMPDSTWVIYHLPSWLSGSLRSFCIVFLCILATYS